MLADVQPADALKSDTLFNTSLLFNTTLGQVVLVACGIWMFIGVMVMSAMINFDF